MRDCRVDKAPVGARHPYGGAVGGDGNEMQAPCLTSNRTPLRSRYRIGHPAVLRGLSSAAQGVGAMRKVLWCPVKRSRAASVPPLRCCGARAELSTGQATAHPLLIADWKHRRAVIGMNQAGCLLCTPTHCIPAEASCITGAAEVEHTSYKRQLGITQSEQNKAMACQPPRRTTGPLA